MTTDSRTPAAHTVRIFTTEHPLDGNQVTAYEIDHPRECDALPPGAICWIEHHPDRHELPDEPGTYQVAPIQELVSDEDGDLSDVREYLAFDKFDPDTGHYAPWQSPPQPERPHAWAAWGRANELLAFGLHTDGRSGWETLGLPQDDPSVIHLEPLNQAAYETLASIVGFADPAPMGHALRDRFIHHRQHADPMRSLATVMRAANPAQGAKMTTRELYEMLCETAVSVVSDGCYTGSISWVMLPGEKKYGVQALKLHVDSSVSFISDPEVLRSYFDHGGEATHEH